MSVLEIQEKALNLPEEDREILMLKLQMSLNQNSDEPPAWHAEILAERERLIESGEATLLSWEEVKAEMKARRENR